MEFVQLPKYLLTFVLRGVTRKFNTKVDWKEVKQKLHDILGRDTEIFLNKQVKIKNLKNNASPKNKICSNISYFYASPNEIMPVKTGRPAIFRVTVTYFNPQKCCPHFYPPSALTSISLFFLSNYSWSRRFGTPPLPLENILHPCLLCILY